MHCSMHLYNKKKFVLRKETNSPNIQVYPSSLKNGNTSMDTLLLIQPHRINAQLLAS